MPTDLEPTPSGPSVTHAGDTRPFQSGLLAASISATGLPAEKTHLIAGQVRSQLSRSDVHDVDTDTLAEMTESTLRRFHGDTEADRYRAWRTIRQQELPVIISISGTAGVGKSAVATRLAMRLGIDRVITSETVLDVLRAVDTASAQPELHRPVFASIDLDQDEPLVPFLDQAARVAETTRTLARGFADRRQSVVFEGTHLIPGPEPIVHGQEALCVELVLTTQNQDWHRSMLLDRGHREAGPDPGRTPEHFSQIRLVQDHLLERADRYGALRFDAEHPGTLTGDVVDHLALLVEQRS